jgi:hypothetical protein
VKKSRWIELVEWCVFALIAVFVFGVVSMRGELTAPPDNGSTAPLETLAE